MPSEITKENIYDILKDFAKEFRKDAGKSTHLELIIVGGGSIMLNYGFRKATQDIDAIVRTVSSIKDAAYRTGDKFGLENGWLNTDFMHTDSYVDKLFDVANPKPCFTYNNGMFVVRTIDAEYLAAMKLISGRDYRNDISDIVGIIKAEKEAGKDLKWDTIQHALFELYGDGASVDANHIEYIQYCLGLDVPELEKEYERRKEDEDYISVKIEDMDQKYPDLIKEDNINTIVSRLLEGKDNSVDEKQETGPEL